MADRTYFQGRPGVAWHALDPDASDPGDWSYVGLCGRTSAEGTREADRVPPAGHLCGSCSRSIAARTDTEPGA